MFSYNQLMPLDHTRFRLPSYSHRGRFCDKWSADGLICRGPGPGERYDFCLRNSDNTIISITYYNATSKIEIESFGERCVVGL
jgi:hypothetical protein